MEKKRIRLTESQLFRLIEESLNELDIRTRANARNKALDDWFKYHQMAKDKSNNPIKRDYADKMANKRWKQQRNFENSITDELRTNGNQEVDFYTNNGYDPRGALYATEPSVYGADGQHKPYSLPVNEPLEKMKEYVKGNSYYDKEKGWKQPGDEDYDVEKSEKWALIRQANESIAHRVTKKIIQNIKEGLQKGI